MQLSARDPDQIRPVPMPAWLSIIIVGGIGAFAIIVIPGVLLALSQELGMSASDAARLATMELLGMLFSTVFLGRFVRGAHARRSLFIAFAVLVAGNISCIWLAGTGALAGARIVCGMADGLALAAMGAAAATVPNPDRLFAVYMATNLMAVLAFFTALPAILAGGGLAGMFIVLASLGALGLVATIWFPSAPSVNPDAPALAPARYGRIAIMGLTASFVFCLGIGLVWPLMGEIGQALGWSTAEVSGALGLAPLGGICAGAIAAFLGARLGRRLPLCVGGFALVASMLLLAGRGIDFKILVTAFMFAWVFVTSYFMGMVAAADEDGRSSALLPATQQAGLALGPVTAASLAVGNSFSVVIVIGAVVCTAGLLLAVATDAAGRSARRGTASATPVQTGA